MNRKALAVLSSLLALTAPVACSSQSKATPAADATPAANEKAALRGGSDTAKVAAPVTVNADVNGDKARVTLRFDAPATDVQVNISGADGLKVKGATTPVNGASFTQAAVSTFDVEFTPGAGRSLLVVAVDGTFRGSHLSKVTTFAVGTPTTEQLKSSGDTVTGSDGERVKIMPMDGQQ
ncbi:hypothetical protein HPC49_49885 [Pyxidicoccus fallax]|uniref:Lipoprotein n=1 Tax=Pyxidicoccus fallax TaxID=394095 RepID=A0A848LZ01_9BACT|nr:hypothetical protein [Pyxidicoccus fallax]NMO22830.1 hypothetical protein [Pyxidicoccus fallax]NPC86285.1 hypothetical protein [Pyxidicoccus fallax]